MVERLHISDPWPFREPWTVVPADGAFAIQDGDDQPFLWVRYADDPGAPPRGKRMTRAQAHRLASCIARLPWLLRR
jgi:hypothetical protein